LTRLLACFQYREDALNFLNQLRERLRKFGLELAEDKTKCLRFGRFAREDARKGGKKPDEFDFLGFTHYCGKTKGGYFKVKRRTSLKRFGRSLRQFTEWARKSRDVVKKVEMIKRARARVIGHLNYYAITDNSERCKDYIYYTTRILFKWLNRKSQRKSYTWHEFGQILLWLNWPDSAIRNDLNPCRKKYRTLNG
jgi:RNA-directed DNA polymerase